MMMMMMFMMMMMMMFMMMMMMFMMMMMRMQPVHSQEVEVEANSWGNEHVGDELVNRGQSPNRGREAPKNCGQSPILGLSLRLRSRGVCPSLSLEKFILVDVQSSVQLKPKSIFYHEFAEDGPNFDPSHIQLNVFNSILNSPIGSGAKPQLPMILAHLKKLLWHGMKRLFSKTCTTLYVMDQI